MDAFHAKEGELHMLRGVRQKAGAAALAMFVVVGSSTVMYATEGSGRDSIEGKLIVAHEYTGADSSVMKMQVGLITADGYVKLDGDVAHDKVMKLTNKNVRVRGKRVAAESFDAEQLAAAPGPQTAAAPAAPRRMRIAAVALDTTDLTTRLQEHFFSAATWSQKSMIERESDGQVEVSGRVFGPYAVGMTNTCSLGELMNAARRAAEPDGYKYADYDTIVVYAPGRSCGFAGVASIGMGGVFLNGFLVDYVTLHELGHNLGVWHAGLLRCGTKWKPSCAVTEYGSPIDVMGAGGTYFSGIHKKMFGWIPPSNVKTVSSGTDTVTVKSHDRPLAEGGTRLVMIPRGDGTSFSIERKNFGGDWNGIWLHLVSSRGGTDIQFFDASPNTKPLKDGALSVGERFTDPGTGITIETLANDDGANTSTVKVCHGDCGTPPTSTTTTAMPPTGDSVTATTSQGKVLVSGTTGNDIVHIKQLRDNLRSIDADGRPIHAGKGCTQTSATVVTCRSSRVYASLGEGNDSVVVEGRGRMQFDGGAGNDTFLGGPSQDVFIGGPGNDAVDYRNRAPGTVYYEIGAGPTSGARGERDDIRSDIESVLVP